MTQGYISFPPVISVNEVLGQFREVARDKDVIMYVYVVDIENHLLGVIDMKELLQAESDNLLHEIMSTSVISFKSGDSLAEVADAFDRYSFRAIPVTDEDERMVGIISYRDVMSLKHKFI